MRLGTKAAHLGGQRLGVDVDVRRPGPVTVDVDQTHSLLLEPRGDELGLLDSAGWQTAHRWRQDGLGSGDDRIDGGHGVAAHPDPSGTGQSAVSHDMDVPGVVDPLGSDDLGAPCQRCQSRPASSHPQQGQCTIGARSGLLETIGIGEFGYARCVSSGSCRDVAGHDPGGELDDLLVADTIRVQTRSRAPAHLGQGTAVRMRTQRPGALAQRGDFSQRSTGVDGVVTPGERSPVHPAGLGGGSHDRQSREGLVGERHPGHLVLASGTTVVPRAVGIDEAQFHHPSLQRRGTGLVTHRGGQPDHLVHAGTMLRGREIG